MASKPILISGGQVLDPGRGYDFVGDVLIVDGKIKEVAPSIKLGSDFAHDVIDATGYLVTPGWVDIHTHLREPGQSHKETIRSGSLAAAAGGFTSIACMANTNPTNDNSFVTSYLVQKINDEAVVNIFVIGAVTKGLKGKELAPIGSMKEAGIVAISDDGKTVMNSYLMRKALDYSKRFDLAVITHCEDVYLKGQGVMNEGFHSAKFGLRGVPRTSEDCIVARDIALGELTGAKLHIAHVSTLGSVQILRAAKKRGILVTGEATPHHLNLTDESVGTYDTNTKVAPPLREKIDVKALREAVQDGTIDTLASDHAPHAAEEKEVEYDLAEFGMVGLETALPLYYQCVLDGAYSLERMVTAMTEAPAKVIGVPKGTLANGADADVTIADLAYRYDVDKHTFLSKSQNTPFHGRSVQGRVCHTVVKGELVYTHPSLRKEGP